MTTEIVGYARVSTDEQSLDLQLDAHNAAGCDRVYQDVGRSRRGRGGGHSHAQGRASTRAQDRSELREGPLALLVSAPAIRQALGLSDYRCVAWRAWSTAVSARRV